MRGSRERGVGKNMIHEVGKVETYYEEIYSPVRPDLLLAEIKLERLVVDPRFPGSQQINSRLKAAQDGLIAYAKKNLALSEADSIRSSYTGVVEKITFFDGQLLSFVQSDYIYEGGAHGMPYRMGWTFDLGTGGRLTLGDLVGDTEQEIKQIVTRYFREYMAGEPEIYWEDALETVWRTAGFESDFYLTDQGIVFFYAPYDLAPFAAGFREVTVPYREFRMAGPLAKRGREA